MRELRGADITATDIRSGMALILAAMCAKGTSRVFGVEHIERGLENMLETFRCLGADINVVDDPDADIEEAAAASKRLGADRDFYPEAGARGYMRKPVDFAVL